MNSDGIKTFIMLSKLKNFTRTAERMYVAQSTVTNRIAELENETGQKLFVRRQGGVELTEEGQLFLSYALRINDLEESFIQEVNSAARYEKQLRVGCINAVYESSLFPLLSRFFSDNQDVSLKVVLGHSADLLQMLQDSRLFIPALQKGGLYQPPLLAGQAAAARLSRGKRIQGRHPQAGAGLV